jgi:hypothetical protein
MPYATDYANANDDSLQQKVRVAAVSAALNIAGEATTTKNTVDEKRHRLAETVLADGCLDQLERFMFAVVATGAITPASTDAQIDTRVAAIWDDLAGVSGRDLA